ncbi:MAG: CDP-alcohol phosphatidyltransferase family protein [Bacteroidia bacterium]|nr:CDP-alcohol phosphatidyltransferase family protein [Bacteroidia bacterium]
MKSIPLTIPNALSLYRLFSVPFICILIALGHDMVFAVLFTINQITDILDGYIARRYKLQSDIGVLLDSYADIGSYLIAFLAILKFHPQLFSDYGFWLGGFFFIYALQLIVCKIKHGRWVAGLHLYSCKLTGYVQGIFLVVLFCYGFITWFFYVMILIGVLAELEVIAINLLSSKPILNAKGLYWVFKEKRL